MMSRIATVAKREFASYFDQATAYILLVIFLGINFYFYFQEAYILREASLRPMLSLLPWLLLFFIPAVCMRTLAEERNAGTLELVLSQPISVVEFLLGKFLGVLLFLLVAMAGTFGIPLGLTFGADLQWGVVFSQYLGSVFLIAALISGWDKIQAIATCAGVLPRSCPRRARVATTRSAAGVSAAVKSTSPITCGECVVAMN